MGYSLYDHILGSMVTAGMGDAIGVPTDAFSRDEIIEKFGAPLDRFVFGGDNAYAIGNHTAEVSDDTTQMFELAKAVIATGGDLTIKAAADALITWSENWPKYYPRNCGPTMRSWIEEYKKGGDPVELAKLGKLYGRGTSNGAAMRCASAGLVNPGDLEGAVQTAFTMTRVSHGTTVAISGACAVSCAIAEGISEGATLMSVIRAARYGAVRGEKLGTEYARVPSGRRLLPALDRAVDIAVNSLDAKKASLLIEQEIGCGCDMVEAMPCAFGLLIANDGDPMKTILACANMGGDTDTVACIAGSMAGAYAGFSVLPMDLYTQFKDANPGLELEWAASQLTEIAKKRMNQEH